MTSSVNSRRRGSQSFSSPIGFNPSLPLPDRVVVLRNGQNAMDKKIVETTLEEVVRAMFGLNVKIT